MEICFLNIWETKQNEFINYPKDYFEVLFFISISVLENFCDLILLGGLRIGQRTSVAPKYMRKQVFF